MRGPTDEQKAEFLTRLGALLDDVDEQTRKPGEPSLREVVAEHAGSELAKLRGKRNPHPTGDQP